MKILGKFTIIPVSELYKVDFTKLCETYADSMVMSVNGLKTYIKWDGAQPAFINSIVGAEGPYTYPEMLVRLSSAEWLVR